jgi:membrane protein DedA with SNARE-associated domain
MVVSVSRRLLFYLASFHLGRALGSVGIPWIEARAARFGQFVRFIERLFARAPRLVVLVLSGPTVAALAGISKMSLAAFVPLSLLSLTVRMLITIYFAEWMREYIELTLAWIDEYWIPGTVLMVAGVALYRWRRRTPLRTMDD